MRLLLDTHALLWWWSGSKLLPRRVHAAITDPANEVHVSVVSAWEVATKERIGKLDGMQGISAEFETLLKADQFIALPLAMPHALRAGSYTQAHRDPFDRMLAAQSELAGLSLVTSDKALAAFPGPRLW
jgi:PIN domain nuclease of toxin-antitoxin system